MNISNFGLYNTSFKGVENRSNMNKEDMSKMDFLTDRATELFLGRIENEVPENGKFSNLSVFWNIPNTQNHGIVFIEADELNPKDSRRIGVASRRRQGSDRLVTSYIFKGTKKEAIEFVKSDEAKQKIKKTAFELSDKIDTIISDLH